MITKIKVENFKCHADTTIIPGKVSALVGPNGAGKTSFLLAIGEFYRLQKEKGDIDTNSVLKFLRVGQDKLDISFDVEAPFHPENATGDHNPDGRTKWRIRLNAALHQESGEIFFRREFTGLNLWDDSEWGWQPITYDDQDNLKKNQFLTLQNFEPHVMERLRKGKQTDVFSGLGDVSLFKGIAYQSAKASYSEDIPPKLEPDGSGLASAIAYLMTYAPDQFASIIEAFKRVVPIVKRVRVRPAKVVRQESRILRYEEAVLPINEKRSVTGQEMIFDTLSGDNLAADMVSEGTLITLGIITSMCTREEGGLVLLDDVEQSLHPLAQRRLMSVLKELAESRKLQIILTSHSPYIVDELDANDVWVMATDKEGISHCKRLSDHPDAERLLEVLTTGELQGAVGEDWVIENKLVLEEVNA